MLVAEVFNFGGTYSSCQNVLLQFLRVLACA